MSIDDLTDRQKEVLIAYVDHGYAKAAARALGISPRTYKNHLNTIFRKLDVCNITQAVIMAFRAGLVKDEEEA